jgi:hypothetical protein
MIGSVTQAQQQMAAIEKKRKAKVKVEIEREGEPLTMAHAVAEGEQDAMARDASKAITGRELNPGPGSFAEPSAPAEPGTYSRPYISEGHGAESPMARPPNTSPLPPQARGQLAPLPMSAAASVTGTGPVARAIAAHQARASADGF